MDTKNRKPLPQRFFKHGLFALFFLLLSRIIAMCFIPLNDVSEARYAEIARKMLATGNWVTPLHDYGVPFWAKPPLSTWLSALSMKLLGINEFAVRLPGLLLSIAVLWLVWRLAKKHSGELIAMLTTLVLAGTLYFFLDAGTVMTDPSLVFCVTLVMVSFWYAVVDGNTHWSYVFFVALGLGLLAKGPVALVLPAMPLFCWVVLRSQWRNLWVRLPWISGLVIMLAIALPWYIWAELRTPGFLDYFIIGENFNRFLKPGWIGDKYGYAHKEPWGMIWVYAASGIFPWCLLGLAWFVKCRYNLRKLFIDPDGWLSYFFLCTVVPLFFFTFSSNIIYTYVFCSLPAFALFFVEYWDRVGVMLRAKNLVLGLSLIVGVIFLAATLAFVLLPEKVAKTHKPVIAAWLKKRPAAGDYLIYWEHKTPFSAQFYAGGKVRFALNDNDFCQLLIKNHDNYLAVKPTAVEDISPLLFRQMELVQRVYAGDKPFLLMRIPARAADVCAQL